MFKYFGFLAVGAAISIPQVSYAAEGVEIRPFKNDVEFVVGEGYYFPEDTDHGVLGLADKVYFDEFEDLLDSNVVDKNSMTVNVQIGAVKPLTKRDARLIDVLNDKAVKMIDSVYGRKVTYLCYGTKKVDRRVFEPVCTIEEDGLDIMVPLLEKGFARYDPEIEESPWQDHLYRTVQKLAKTRKIGVWAASGLYTNPN